MVDPQGPPHDDPLRRFDARYETLAASQARKPRRFDSGVGAEAGYRVLGELLGGVLGGLGLGWVVDRVAGTTPWGLIAGVVIGLAAAVWLVARPAMSSRPPPAAGRDNTGRPEGGED